MSLYRRLAKEISSQGITSLTIDIFDTILLRKIWPEDVQFFYVAKKWQQLFRQLLSDDITAGEIYQIRIYSRNELKFANQKYNSSQKKGDFSLENNPDYDVNPHVWFNEIIRLFEIKYNQKLGTNTKEKLLKYMISSEIETEKENLIPNQKLVNVLKRVKKENPSLKIYFASDMYLKTDEIYELLHSFNIDIFDAGVCSTEIRHTKASGELFDYLHEKKYFGNKFNISHNIHIGDNKQSDYRSALLSGSNAILYKKIRLRKLRTIMGRFQIHGVNKHLSAHDKHLLDRACEHGESPNSIWQSYGTLLSQPLYIFLCHLITVSRQALDTQFVMVSSEADIFMQYATRLDPSFPKQKNITIANKLNRRRMIRALLWSLIQNKNYKYNPEALYFITNLGETNGSRRDFYDFIFGSEYPYSEMATNVRSQKNFIKALLNDLENATEQQTKPFKEAYDYALSLLSSSKDKKIVIVDVGWGGTVQVLFSQFANIHGYRTKIDGLYLGVMPNNRFAICEMPPMEGYLLPDVKYGKDRSLFCAVLWEYPYTNKTQFSGDIARLSQIRIGLQKGLSILSQTKLSPKSYFDKIVRSKIKRLVANPTRTEAGIIGSIRFDMGFAEPSSYTAIEMGLSRRQIIKQLFIHPRATIKNTIFAPNRWAGGFIKYYRIPIVKVLVKVYEKLHKKTLI